MLAYSLPEAQDLLESKLTAAQLSLDNCEEDLDFLREQITVSERQTTESGSSFALAKLRGQTADVSSQTLEVATARVYNWDVAQRRKDKDGEDGSIEAGNASSSGG